MRLESGDRVTPIRFDGGASEVGSNKVGGFDLAHGNVRLIVTNRTDGETVVADAIRWSRVDDGSGSMRGARPSRSPAEAPCLRRVSPLALPG